MTNKSSRNSHNKWLSIMLLALVACVGMAIYFGIAERKQAIQIAQHIKIDGIFVPTPTDITDFQLTDNVGKTFTKENLKGHWTMMFFGFTNCGMVCPTTLAELNKMYRTLQKELPDTQLPQVVLVSVDPERDTIERMNEYVTTFNPHFIGVRGDLPETESLKKQLHIVSAKMQADGQGQSQYTINHSAEIMLFNPEAKVQAYLSYPHKADQMVSDYKSILSTTKS